MQSTAPSSGACFSGTFSVEDRHVPGDWRPAGTTPGGHRVYVPAPGGNPVSRVVRAWQAQTSFTFDDAAQEFVEGPAAYGYGTDEQFLADNARYAIQGPAGEWSCACASTPSRPCTSAHEAGRRPTAGRGQRPARAGSCQRGQPG